MSEWWTYTLSDFLLFSPRTYYRLLELYNLAIWPAQLVWLGLGIHSAVLLQRGGQRPARTVAAILAGAWLWVAVAFHLQRFATINWAAVYYAAAFVVQAALLVWLGVIRGELAVHAAKRGLERAGFALFLFALFVYPLIGRGLDRPWTQVEVFGVAPDPTVAATLGFVLLASARARWVLLLVPILWCAVGGATLWAMKSPTALVLPLAALLVVLLALAKTVFTTRTGSLSEPARKADQAT
jgi:hypothetical protein